MQTLFQVVAAAIISAIACCTVGRQAGAVTTVLSIAACVFILLVSLQFIRPVLEVLERLQSMTGLSGTIIAPVLKVAGVGVLVQIAGTVCQDAGEQALQKSVEIAGTIISLYVSLPLVTSVLDLLEEILKQ